MTAISVSAALNTRTCSACGTAVARTQCHKNRYGEYICHKCGTSGVRFTLRSRVRHTAVQLPLMVVYGLAGVTLAGVILAALVALFSD